jgi:hypothetical protein
MSEVRPIRHVAIGSKKLIEHYLRFLSGKPSAMDKRGYVDLTEQRRRLAFKYALGLWLGEQLGLRADIMPSQEAGEVWDGYGLPAAPTSVGRYESGDLVVTDDEEAAVGWVLGVFEEDWRENDQSTAEIVWSALCERLGK